MGQSSGPRSADRGGHDVTRVAVAPASSGPVLAASVAACDVFEGRQSVTAYADDSTITNSIRARYLEDPMVHFGDVGVTTLNGAVRLTGRVNSERERQRAGQIAREVKGVRGVTNEIAVR
jgi:hyperosmotically inducible periplasmic protein